MPILYVQGVKKRNFATQRVHRQDFNDIVLHGTDDQQRRCIPGAFFDAVIKCHWFLDAAMQLGFACAS